MRSGSEYEMLRDGRLQELARLSLPVLVRQVEAAEPITYGDLGIELGSHGRPFGQVLGLIAGDLSRFSKKSGLDIPPIMAIVVNSSSGLPGDGYYTASETFSERWLGPPDALQKLTNSEKRLKFRPFYEKMSQYRHWDKVLREFRLRRLTPSRSYDDTAEDLRRKGFKPEGAGGESPAHKLLKEFLYENPALLNMPSKVQPITMEYLFLTQDRCDILFENSTNWWLVEVKPANAPKEDILRGLHQCIKYRALAEARRKVEGRNEVQIHTILALGGSLPESLRGDAHTLGIDVRTDMARLLPSKRRKKNRDTERVH